MRKGVEIEGRETGRRRGIVGVICHWGMASFLRFVISLVQENGPSLNFHEARKICLQQLKNLACVQLVYGHAG